MESIFGDAVAAAEFHVSAHHGVCPATSEKCSGEISAAGSDVEEAGLQGGGEVEARVEDVADRCEEGVHVPDERGGGNGDDDEVGIFEEDDDAGRVDPVPDVRDLLRGRERFDVVGAFLVNCFGEEEDDEDGGEGCEGGLEPENVAPGHKGDDDAADEGTKRGSDEGSTHEPGVGRSSLHGSVDVSNGGASDDEECRALKGREHAKYKVRSEIRGQCRSGREGGKGHSSPYQGPFPAICLAQWTPDEGTQTHEEHVQCVGNVEDGAGRVVGGDDFGRGSEDGGG